MHDHTLGCMAFTCAFGPPVSSRELLIRFDGIIRIVTRMLEDHVDLVIGRNYAMVHQLLKRPSFEVSYFICRDVHSFHPEFLSADDSISGLLVGRVRIELTTS